MPLTAGLALTCLLMAQWRPAAAIVAAIADDAKLFIHNARPGDDQALVVIKRI
jgi:hypothetical protein